MILNLPDDVLGPWPTDFRRWVKEQCHDLVLHDQSEWSEWPLTAVEVTYSCMDGQLMFDKMRSNLTRQLDGLEARQPCGRDFLLTSPGGNMPLYDNLMYEVLAKYALIHKVRFRFTRFIFAPHDKHKCAGVITGTGMGPGEGIRWCIGFFKRALIEYPGLFVNERPSFNMLRVDTATSNVAKVGRPPEDDPWKTTPAIRFNPETLTAVLDALRMIRG